MSFQETPHEIKDPVRHTFVAERVPNEHELHCFYEHLTHKSRVPSKTIVNGRIVELVCERSAIEPKTIFLDTNKFTFKRTIKQDVPNVQVGQIVSISARLCYTVHTARAGRQTEVPVDYAGHVKPHLKAIFYAYLERMTGIGEIASGGADMFIVPEAIPDEMARSKKVWFNGAMSVTLTGKIKDVDACRRLWVQSIGNCRSYGFGSAVVSLGGA